MSGTRWSRQRIESIFAPIRKTYADYLFNRLRNLDVTGLPTPGQFALPLDFVFVDVSLNSQPMHQVTANALAVPPALRKGSHSIWEYLAASQSADQQHFALLGAPGNGKTTLLKYMAICLIGRWRGPLSHSQLRKMPHTPLLLFLREHAEAISKDALAPNDPNHKSYSLVDAFCDQLRKYQPPEALGDWIKQQIDKHN